MEGDIEVKSESVLKIVGKIPPFFVQYGIFLLTGITIFIFFLSYILKFPASFTLSGTLLDNNEIILYVSDKKILNELQSGTHFTLINGGKNIYKGKIGEIKTNECVKNMYKVRINCFIPQHIFYKNKEYLYKPGNQITLSFEGKDIKLFDLLFKQ